MSHAISEEVKFSMEQAVSHESSALKELVERGHRAVDGLAELFDGHQSWDENQYLSALKEAELVTGLPGMMLGLESGEGYASRAFKGWPQGVLQPSQDVTGRRWYQVGRSGNDTQVTDVYFVPGDTTPYLSIVKPASKGVVAASLAMSELDKVLSQVELAPGTIAILAEQSGNIIATTSKFAPVQTSLSAVPGLGEQANRVLVSDSLYSEYVLNDTDKLVISNRIPLPGGNSWYFLIAVEKDVVYASVSEANQTVVLTGVISTLISALVLVVMLNYLYRPIVALKERVQDLAEGEGDLTQRLEVRSDDDLGKISNGINTVVSSLQTMMLEVRQVTGELAHGVDVLKTQAEENEAILASHMSETDQVATAMEELNATAETVASSAAEAAQYTREANQTGEQSKVIVAQAQSSVISLVEEVEVTAGNIQSMSDETHSINSILKVIGEIADQTNLLALNAAIEAARAGAQGRGFAVVAEEVRALAGRTQQSTAEIEKALEVLLQGSSRVVTAMAGTKKTCEETASGAQEVSGSLETMSSFVSDINDLSSQIATAAEEQSSVSQEISRNMTAIREMVLKLADSGNQTLDEANSLAAVNTQLLGIVSRFKLD
ncbi:methyl-accepting chemotaxis protein [Ferrimonas futtsuensis]|uniref:methyl-accepting chemotaxis protein n=1 Tax=Ferrimonas futtsuensis TaxID=364764 RepID=UPI000684CB05|nr:methyl-accepting chemotaxis protein [Ferrimonas futtsuensis]